MNASFLPIETVQRFRTVMPFDLRDESGKIRQNNYYAIKQYAKEPFLVHVTEVVDNETHPITGSPETLIYAKCYSKNDSHPSDDLYAMDDTGIAEDIKRQDGKKTKIRLYHIPGKKDSHPSDDLYAMDDTGIAEDIKRQDGEMQTESLRQTKFAILKLKGGQRSRRRRKGKKTMKKKSHRRR